MKMAYLKIHNNDGIEQTRFDLNKHILYLISNFDDGNNSKIIALEDSSVQSRHALILRQNDGFKLVTFPSSITTLENNNISGQIKLIEPLEYHSLQHNDRINFGEVLATFCIESDLDIFAADSCDILSKNSDGSSSINIPETQSDVIMEFETQDEINNSPVVEQSVFQDIYNRLGADEIDAESEIFDASNDGCEDSGVENKSCDQNDPDNNKNLSATQNGLPENSANLSAPTQEALRNTLVTPELQMEIEVAPETLGKNADENFQASQFFDHNRHKFKVPFVKIEDTQSNKENVSNQIMQETQPNFPVPMATRQHLKRQSEIKPKTASLLEFETQEDEPQMKKQCFDELTQPLFSRQSQGVKMPESSQNRILLSSSDDEEEDNIPLETQTQSGMILNSIVPSQLEDQSMQEDETQSSPMLLMNECSTPDIIPKLPELTTESQKRNFLEQVNESRSTQEETLVFEDVTQPIENADLNVEQTPVKPVKEPRRRNLMRYDSDDEKADDEEEIEKPQTSTGDDHKEDAAAAHQKFIFSYSNIKITEYEDAILRLGGEIVDNVADANIHLTQVPLKLTAKLLSSINKGNPIVDEKYLEDSEKAEEFQEPFDYIILDKKVEKQKQTSLKESILKGKAKKLFENYSVYVFNGLRIKYDELEEMVINGGGEFIPKRRTKATHSDVIFIYNPETSDLTEGMLKRYRQAVHIYDTDLSKVIFSQKIRSSIKN